jgi:hypothetical protein
MIAMIREHTAVDEMDANVKKVLGHIHKAGKRGISRMALLRKTSLMADVLDKIENTLLARGEIKVESLEASKNGKSPKQYYIVTK